MSFAPKTITIYSVGLIGGSFGLALKAAGYTGRIIGLSSPRNCADALSNGAIDEAGGYGDLPAIIHQTDLLVLSSPINAIKDILKKLSGITLPKGLVITDVGSTKKEIMALAAEILPAHVHFLGGHPMAGSEKTGASAADPHLFQNAVYALCPAGKGPDKTDEEIAAFLGAMLGSRQIFLDPDSHDRIAAAVSHLPHLLAVALTNVAAQVENEIPGTLDLAAGGFRNMTRIASSPYAIWHDILATNREPVAELIERITRILAEMRQDLGTDRLGAQFEQSALTRSRIPEHNTGFIEPLAGVLVQAPDRPGQLAAITAVLAENQINIKGIEILNVREGEGGTIQLVFASSAIAHSVINLLNQRGFPAREKE